MFLSAIPAVLAAVSVGEASLEDLAAFPEVLQIGPEAAEAFREAEAVSPAEVLQEASDN